jgi:hypothetical protein
VTQAADRFLRSSSDHSALYGKAVSDSVGMMENMIGRNGEGEYLVSRAIGAKLTEIGEVAMQHAATNPQAQEHLRGLMSKLPEDKRIQPSSRRLREVAEGLSGMLPQSGKLAEMRVTLDCASKGAEMLSQVEQRRWTQEHFDGDRIKKTAHEGIEKAYALEEKSFEINRSLATKELQTTLGNALRTGMQRNPAPKHKPLYEEATKQFDRIFKKDAYSDEATGLAEAVLRSGLVSDEKTAQKLMGSIAKVSVSLDRDQTEVDARVDAMRAEEKSGKPVEAILTEHNKRLAEEMAKKPEGKAAFAAVRESMEKSSDIEARQREAAVMQRAASPTSGDAYIQAKANAAYGQEAAIRATPQNAYGKKKQDDDRQGGVDLRA